MLPSVVLLLLLQVWPHTANSTSMAGRQQKLVWLALLFAAAEALPAGAVRPISAQPMRYLLQTAEDPYTTGVPMVDDEVGTPDSSLAAARQAAMKMTASL
jgi:hypothetical protein